jgi:TonB family protein
MQPHSEGHPSAQQSRNTVVHSRAARGGASPPTANDLLKLRARGWYPRAIVLAVLMHVAVLTLTPEFSVADTRTERAPELLVIPELADLPPPPEPIARPAAPIVGSPELDADVTIERTLIDAWDPRVLAPPPRTDDEEASAFRMFVPSMIAPELLNAAEVERELTRRYPAAQRAAGVGGQVDVQLWLDEEGRVVRSAIARSSGDEALDAAALKVVDVMRLSPARSRNVPVRVIVTVPVLFRVR